MMMMMMIVIIIIMVIMMVMVMVIVTMIPFLTPNTESAQSLLSVKGGVVPAERSLGALKTGAATSRVVTRVRGFVVK